MSIPGLNDVTAALGDAVQAGANLVTGDVEGARNALSEADSALTGDTSRADAAAISDDQQRAAQQDQVARQTYSEQRSEYVPQVRDGFDSQSLTNFENWEGFDHQTLYAKSRDMESGSVLGSADAWGSVGNTTKGAFERLQSTIDGAIKNGWEGAAADSASGATSAYIEVANGFSPACYVAGSKVQEAATGADETRATMPEPVEFNVRHALLHGVASSLLGPLAGGNDVVAQMQAKEKARQEAVQVMRGTYQPVYSSADTGVPNFAPPNSPIGGAPEPGAQSPAVPGTGDGAGSITGAAIAGGVGIGGGSIGGGSTGGGAGLDRDALQGVPGGAGPGSSGVGTTAGTASAGYAPLAPVGGASDGGVPVGSAAGVSSGYGAGTAGSGYGSGYAPGSGTTPAGFGPVGSTTRTRDGGTELAPFGAAGRSRTGARGTGTPAGTAGGIGGLSGAGSGSGSSLGGRGAVASGGGAARARGGIGEGAGGRGGVGGGPGGRGGVGEGAGGRAGGGAGSLARGGGLAGAAGESVAGGGASRGGAGAPMMGAGRGKKGEDDGEHEVPSYLITEEHGSQLVGEMPPVAPPVIGA